MAESGGQSGLTSSDLKALCNSLVDTLKSAFHVRIEYPWQKEEREAKAAAAASDGAAAAAPPAEPAAAEVSPTITQRLFVEERLDSADAPRPTPSPKSELKP